MLLNKLTYLYNMIRLIKLSTLFITFLLVTSCKTSVYSFLEDYKVKNLPIEENTNFSNHAEVALLSKKEQKILSLDTILGEELKNEKARIEVSYLANISENYTSIVYCFYPNDTEITTILVNYTKDFKFISSQIVAYDEIADGLLKTTSTIYKDKIELKEFVADNPSSMLFNILENGNITRK